ncbi:MAG: Cytochrome c551 peroxidase [Phycisphaerae bacterium]|nr:Cytochrome c551 peroxidase [Phycisphaerae bacterium]
MTGTSKTRPRGGTAWAPAWAAWAALLAATPGPAAAQTRPDAEWSEQELRRIFQFSPLPEPPPDPTNRVYDDTAAARLGQFLFYDERLSGNGKISCATCHDPERAFTDGRSVFVGVAEGTRNTPGLLNVAQQRWFFWDGRADTLWAQALQPIENPIEMDGARVAIVRLLLSDASLRAAYERVFGGIPVALASADLPPAARPAAAPAGDARQRAWAALSSPRQEAINRVFTNVGKAIAAYERRLVGGHSPFDRYVKALRDNDAAGLDALSAEARRGLRIFIGEGNCRMCHHGPNFSDGEFHSVQVPPRGGGPPSDPGRYDGAARVVADEFNALGRYSDAPDGPAAEKLRRLRNTPENWGLFKTPSLRNVARTAPYMHQGQFAALDDVLDHYSNIDRAPVFGHHKRETVLQPLRLSEADHKALRAFLESLSDEAPDAALTTRPAEP